jgi:hypothetical protein
VSFSLKLSVLLVHRVTSAISVHGLNLQEPESAQELIKPWDEREDVSKYADTVVDDQV